MILVEDVKYSCIECIRGHRSSQCRHHSRPLLQVRSKGRPNVGANGNPNHRVAVFAEEIKQNQAPCANKSKDVIVIIKASSKKIIDLTSGKIVGSYSGQEDTTRKRGPIINENSFVNSTMCCAGNASKVTKNKNCGCEKKANKSVNHSNILNRYFKTHPENRRKLTFVSENRDLKAEGSGYSMISVPSCSIPGTCCCNDDCSCEGCLEHNKALDVELIGNNNNIDDIFNNSLQFNLKNLKVEDVKPEISTNGGGCCGNSAANDTASCAEAPVLEGLLPTAKIPYMTYLSDLSGSTLDQGTVSQPELVATTPGSESSEADCNCPPEACNCTNCETHGIIDNIKLDELFSSQFDARYLSLFNDLQSSGGDSGH